MSAESETISPGNASSVEVLWPSLQKNLARAQRMRSERMRSWTQQMMLRLALFWLSLAIAWAGLRTVGEISLRRWFR